MSYVAHQFTSRFLLVCESQPEFVLSGAYLGGALGAWAPRDHQRGAKKKEKKERERKREGRKDEKRGKEGNKKEKRKKEGARRKKRKKVKSI